MKDDCQSQSAEINEVLALNQTLRQHCSTAGKERLGTEANHVSSEYSRLQALQNTVISRLDEVLAQRQRFKDDVGTLLDVLHQQEVAIENQKELGRDELKDRLVAIKV